MFGNITQAVEQIKSDVARALDAALVVRLCSELGHRWRQRELDPVTTVQGFLLQVLHGNTACSHVPHLLGKKVSAEAYGLARARLPLALFERLLGEVCRVLQSCRDESARWCGHRVWTMDGSSCSMPDTPELQEAFGQNGQQAAGCGFPVAHLLTLFHAGTGMLLRVVTAPLRTHDMAQAAQLHGELEAGDVVLADRGFCSYAHLTLLVQAGLHGVFRLHQKQLVSFRIGRMHVPPSPPFAKLKAARGLPRSRWITWLGKLDQQVEYFKPKQRPSWMNPEVYAALPGSIVVRDLRYQVMCHGRNTVRIAKRFGWLPGARYTNLRDIRNENIVGLIDIDWKRYDFARHLAVVKQWRPFLTIAKDVEDAGELRLVLRQAEQLQCWCRHVVIVPKDPSLSTRLLRLIPQRFVLGYSVPTRYGGTTILPEYFGRRRVHLLGGRPDVQFELARRLNVYSIDGNRLTLDATYGDYFNGERFVPHPRGGYERCIRESLRAINRLWARTSRNGRSK